MRSSIRCASEFLLRSASSSSRCSAFSVSDGAWGSGITIHSITAEFPKDFVRAERTFKRKRLRTPATIERSPVSSGTTISIAYTLSRSSMETASTPASAFLRCVSVSSGWSATVLSVMARATRLTSSATREAFQSVHAARPVASPSAMLSA